MTYNLLKKLETSGGKFNYSIFIIGLYFRLTPALIGSILFIYLLPLFGDGPLWTDSVMLKDFVGFCQRNIHKSLLYVNNFENLFIENVRSFI